MDNDDTFELDHYYKPGCCDELEEHHRPMTYDEYEAEFPLVFDQTVTAADGDRYRVDARRYWDGVGVCITQLYPEENEIGICFDIDLLGLSALLPLLQEVVDRNELKEG